MFRETGEPPDIQLERRQLTEVQPVTADVHQLSGRWN
jgi:hypothetical protein